MALFILFKAVHLKPLPFSSLRYGRSPIPNRTLVAVVIHLMCRPLAEIKPRPSAANENILGNYLASLVRSLSDHCCCCGSPVPEDGPNFKRISVK